MKVMIAIILLFSSCNAQDNKKKDEKETVIDKQIEMAKERFDIEKFEKNKVNNEYHLILDDGTRIRQIGSSEDYTVYTIPPPPELFQEYKQFYKSGELQRHAVLFPRSFIKLKMEYDKSGKLIEEINYDKPYKFTFEQVLELIDKEEDTIDLHNINTTIGRKSDENGTNWYVTYKKVPMRRETIQIDGITGEIIERSFHPHEDN